MERYTMGARCCPDCFGFVSIWETKCSRCGREIGYVYQAMEKAMDFTEHFDIL